MEAAIRALLPFTAEISAVLFGVLVALQVLHGRATYQVLLHGGFMDSALMHRAFVTFGVTPVLWVVRSAIVVVGALNAWYGQVVILLMLVVFYAAELRCAEVDLRRLRSDAG